MKEKQLTQQQKLHTSQRLAVLKFPPASPKNHEDAKKEFDSILSKFGPILKKAVEDAKNHTDPIVRSEFMKEENLKFMRLVDFYENSNGLKWWKVNRNAFRNNFSQLMDPSYDHLADEDK